MVDRAHYITSPASEEIPLSYGWREVEPDAYDEAVHKGQLRCPGPDCHVPMGYVGAVQAEGHLVKRSAHFSANQNAAHVPGCEFSSDTQHRIQIRLEEIAALDKSLLLYYNGPTMPDKFIPRIRSAFTAASLGGMEQEEWKRMHRGGYGTFRTKSVEGLMSHIRKWSRISGNGSLSERCYIAHQGHVVPWQHFFLSDHTIWHKRNSDLKIGSIFKAGMERSIKIPEQVLYPSALPRMRFGLKNKFEAGAATSRPDFIHTASSRFVEINNREVELRDVVQVADRDLQKTLRAAERFSVVATPNVQAWSITNGVNGSAPAVYMFWPVVDQSQIYIG
jgi:hypothetical protein